MPCSRVSIRDNLVSDHRPPDTRTRTTAGVQARLGFGGLLACFDSWLNHPHPIGYAEYKPVQLRAARESGLRVPRTLLTNDPRAARAFVAAAGEAVYKPFGGVAAVTDIDGVHQLFATPVDATRAGDPAVAHTMHLFQRWVPKAFEVRLTVVDGGFFAARIDADSDEARTDWRSD
jgi:glutathione synthase/RimK-type ligase-like ATP-grasp enzyme